jgi:hypothetical protein
MERPSHDARRNAMTETMETVDTLPPYVRDLLRDFQEAHDVRRAAAAKGKDLARELEYALEGAALGECPDWCDGTLERIPGHDSHKWRPYDGETIELIREHAGKRGTRYCRQFEIIGKDGTRVLTRINHSSRSDYIYAAPPA